MADKKPSGFRFRLPWEPNTQSPSPTPQASVASTSAKRPPFQQTKETQTTIETVQTSETEPAIAKIADTIETQPTKETQTAVETPPRQPQSQQPSPPQTPSSTEASSLSSPSHTPPSSPSKTSSSQVIPKIKRSTEITKVKGAQTKSTNIPHSMETKSQKPKPITASTRIPLPREIKDDISKFIHKIATTSTSKQSTNELPASVITIAGENKGAFMHLNSDSVKREIKKDSKLGENEETKEIINSNIQGVNNSMMFNSSVSEKNPGVHLVITRNLPANMNDSEMKNADSMEMQRAEFNVSPPQKVVYSPTIEISVQANEPDDFETNTDSYEIEVL